MSHQTRGRKAVYKSSDRRWKMNIQTDDALKQYPWLADVIGDPDPGIDTSIAEATMEGQFGMDLMVQTGVNFRYSSRDVTYGVTRKFHFVIGGKVWKEDVVPPALEGGDGWVEFPEVTLLDILLNYAAGGRRPEFIVSDEYLDSEWPMWEIKPTPAGLEFVESRPQRVRMRIITIIPVDAGTVEHYQSLRKGGAV